MPRITKKMKMEELKTSEEQIANLVMMCNGYSVSSTYNVIDEYGTRLTFGSDDKKKFLKWGDGPFRFKEIKFDPVNNFKLTNQIFGSFIAEFSKEAAEEEPSSGSIDLASVTAFSLRDGETVDAETGVTEKFVELVVPNGTIESERYLCPTLGFIEVMLYYSGLLDITLLKRVDELKNELEQ